MGIKKAGKRVKKIQTMPKMSTFKRQFRCVHLEKTKLKSGCKNQPFVLSNFLCQNVQTTVGGGRGAEPSLSIQTFQVHTSLGGAGGL